jgi:tetratricopeptide (TPR) repeat protein
MSLPLPPRRCLYALLSGFVLSAAVAAFASEGDEQLEPPTPAPKPPVVHETPRDEAVLSPETRGLLKLGDTLTDRGDFSAAEIAYRQILNSAASTTAEHQEALIGLARTFRRQGTFTKAAAIYEKYLKEYPDDGRVPDVLLDLGRTLRAMGAHKLAISRFYSVLNSTLKLPPDAFDHYQLLAKTAQFEIAETHFETGNFAEAGKFFGRLRLLDLAPVDRARAHFKAAYAAQLGGDPEGAVRTLRSYLDQWPADENVPEARYLLATTLRQLNRSDEALVATLELLRGEKTNSSADPKRWAYWQRRTGNQLANEFFHAGDTANALAIYQGLAALSAEPAWKLPATYQVALCLERLRASDRARDAYQTIIDGAKGATATELIELAKMASWRLANMAWNEQADQKLTSFFSTTTGLDTPPAKSSPPAPNDASASPAATPAAL